VPVERTELSKYRSIGSLVGQMTLSIIAPIVVYDANSNPVASNFFLIAGVSALIGAVTLLLTANMCTERVHVDNATTQKINFVAILKSISKNRPMIFCILSYIIMKLFVQTSSISAQYTFMYYFNDTKYLSLVSMAGLIGILVGAAVVKPLSLKFGKQFLCSWPLLIAGIVYLLMAFLPINALTWAILSIPIGIATSGYGMLMWALITDCIDYQEIITGERMDGTIYSFYNFLVKLVGSFGSALVVGVLVYVGYDATLGSDQLPQTCQNIKVASALMPALGLIVIFLLMKFGYNLDKKMENTMYEELQARRNATEKEVEK
jgi:GPH family glycoside/pentoside/hexuronide:cation symporter